MIFVICLIVTIVFIVLAVIFERNDYDIANLISGIIAAPVVIATIIMLIALAITYIDCPRTEAIWEERYASLNTRIEEHMYYPWDREQLIEEVQKWNEDFAAQEKSHNNFWVGIFNPENIEGLDKIELDRIK
jgi:hypothetical protein